MFRTILGRAAAGFDRAVATAVLRRSRKARSRSRAESLGHDERMRALEHIRNVYDRPEHFTHPSSFFPRVAAPSGVRLEHVRRMAEGGVRGEVVDALWPSLTALHCDEVLDRWGKHDRNRIAAARLFLHDDRPRPAVILVHGYRCGQFGLEERAWPLSWLFRRGLDVALAVLPFHGLRATPGPPLFPSSDPRFTNEGFRQAVCDLGALASLLRERGAPAVGMMGMSLGGYTISLAATVLDDLAFLVPLIPLASIADFARDGGRLVGSPAEQRLQHEALEAAHRVVSPLARPVRLAPDRILVVAAQADRITPIGQAERLATHFGAPLERLYGGHLLQFGRSDAFRAIGKLLGRLGMFEPPGGER